MKNLQIFIAVSLGIMIGMIISYSVQPAFWWIGMIVGGTVGYLSYCFREVCQAVRKVGQAMIKPNFRNGLLMVIVGFVAIVWFVGAFMVPGMLLIVFLLESFSDDPVFLCMVFARLITIAWLIIAGGCGFQFMMDITGDAIDGSRWRYLWKSILFLNPITLVTYWPIRVLCALAEEIADNIGSALAWIGKFTLAVLVEIHSQERLLCLLDAALGVAIGHFRFLEQPDFILLGACAAVGGLFGVAHYELISKRLLKLVSG